MARKAHLIAFGFITMVLLSLTFGPQTTEAIHAKFLKGLILGTLLGRSEGGGHQQYIPIPQ